MATTISRLAAILTTDNAGFDSGMQKAGQKIQQLDRQTDASNARMLGKLRQFATASGAFGRFGGLSEPLTAVLGPVGLLATALTAAGAAAVRSHQELTKINEQFSDARIKAIREWGDAIEKAGGQRPGGTRGLVTKEEFDRRVELGRANLKESLANEPGLGSYFTSFFSGLANKSAAARIGEALEGRLSLMQKRTRAAVDDLKIELDAEKKITDAVDKHREALEALNLENYKRGQQVTESLAKPDEKLRSVLAELDALRSGGFIGDETLTRGIQKAATDYEKSILGMLDAKRTLVDAPGALTRGSVAEFSARVQAGLQSRRLETVAAESLKVEKQTLEEIKKLNNKPQSPIKFGVADI